MPDTAILERPLAPLKAPGSEWPTVTYPTHRVKACLVVVGEFRTAQEEAAVREAIEAARARLEACPGVTVSINFEQV